MCQHVHLLPWVFLPLYIYKPVLVFLLTLSRPNSKWALAFPSKTCMLRWHLYSRPGLPVLVLTSGILFLYRVCLRAHRSSMQIYCHACFVWPPAHQGRPLLRPEELFLENWPALLQSYFLHGQHSMSFTQAKQAKSKVQVWDPAISLFPLNILNSTILCLLQPRPSESWLALWKVWSLLEYLVLTYSLICVLTTDVSFFQIWLELDINQHCI